MINTDKYEGHTENKWAWYEFNDGDWILCPLHDDVKPDPDDLWWGVDEETGEPLETHAALNWDERILDLSSDCMTGNNNPTRKDFVYCSHSSVRLPRKRADMNLIQDAPLLLAEVKRLREAIAKRDALVNSMNTATVAFIDKYYALDYYMLYTGEEE